MSQVDRRAASVEFWHVWTIQWHKGAIPACRFGWRKVSTNAAGRWAYEQMCPKLIDKQRRTIYYNCRKYCCAMTNKGQLHRPMGLANAPNNIRDANQFATYLQFWQKQMCSVQKICNKSVQIVLRSYLLWSNSQHSHCECMNAHGWVYECVRAYARTWRSKITLHWPAVSADAIGRRANLYTCQKSTGAQY